MKKFLFFVLLLAAAGGAYAQLGSPFTVLSNNADTANKLLYVEITYDKPACGDYEARFFLTKSSGDTSAIAVDSFLNNAGTFETDKNRMSLKRPTAGGYRLRFDLTAVDEQPHVDSNYQICIKAYTMAYKCVGCAAGGSDAIFAKADIAPDCPYVGGDLIACYRRESRAGNWEAWIRDPRDCKPYRIVQLRDGKWWYAQNLRYTTDLEAGSGLGKYLCPSGKSFFVGSVSGSNDTTAAFGESACSTYGALYSWHTAVALNGRSVAVENSTPTPVGEPSNTPDICPEGWLLPSDYDWGAALNAMEDGCTVFTVAEGAAPCNHIRGNNASVGAFGSKSAAANIKATHSCPPHALTVDPFCATATRPAWSWRRDDYAGRVTTPFALGTDKYGFSALPAGLMDSQYRRVGRTAVWWSATEHSNPANSLVRVVDSENVVQRSSNAKNVAYSVRCMAATPVINVANAAYTFEPYLALSITRIAQPNSYTYHWESSYPSVTFSNNDATAAKQVTLPLNGIAAGSTIRLSATATLTESGKAQPTAVKDVTVTTYNPTITAPDSVCYMENINLSITPASLNPQGYTYTWSVAPNDGKLTFTTNGTLTAYTTTAAVTGLTAADVRNYIFTCTVRSITTNATVTRTDTVKVASIWSYAGITTVANANGTNGGAANIVATPSSTATVDWYDAPNGGSKLLSGNASYATTMPTRVWAEARHTATGCINPARMAGVAAFTYTYEGAARQVNLRKGLYKMEAWGAQGGNNSAGARGGYGGYTRGDLTLNAASNFYVHVGQQPAANVSAGGYNGGGSAPLPDGTAYSDGGGGATDIRTAAGAWNTAAGLRSRIMVAAGGGGNGGWNGTVNAAVGGAGGGTVGRDGAVFCSGCDVATQPVAGKGATQTAGGASAPTVHSSYPKGVDGTFGVGGNGQTSYYGGGGGGGYYGGGGGGINSNVVSSGGGGSSFISGHYGCNAVNAAGTHTGTPAHFSGHVFSTTSMIAGTRGGHGQVVITPLDTNDCPYKGTDLVPGSCLLSGNAAKNWVAQINPAGSYLATATKISRMSSGLWYTEPLNIPSKRAYLCTNGHASYATANASRITYCPAGWRLLTSGEEFVQLFSAAENYQTQFPKWGLTWYNDNYGANCASTGSHLNLWLQSQTGSGDWYVGTTSVYPAYLTTWTSPYNDNLRCVRAD